MDAEYISVRKRDQGLDPGRVVWSRHEVQGERPKFRG